MKRSPSKPKPPGSPARQLAGFMAKFDPAIGKRGAAAARGASSTSADCYRVGVRQLQCARHRIRLNRTGVGCHCLAWRSSQMGRSLLHLWRAPARSSPSLERQRKPGSSHVPRGCRDAREACPGARESQRSSIRSAGLTRTRLGSTVTIAPELSSAPYFERASTAAILCRSALMATKRTCRGVAGDARLPVRRNLCRA